MLLVQPKLQQEIKNIREGKNCHSVLDTESSV